MKLKHSVVFVMALLASACIGRVQKPEVQLAGVRVAGIGLKGATLIADLDVNNPNDISARTDSIVYELWANTTGSEWTKIIARNYGVPITLQDNRVTRVEVPIEFNFADLQGPGRAILDRGTFNYRLQGTVYLKEPVRRNLPFSKTGNVSMQGVR